MSKELALNNLFTGAKSELVLQSPEEAKQLAERFSRPQFLQRIQLFSKGKPIDKGLIKPGHYGIPSGDKIIDLGESIDVIPLYRRCKAIDMNDTSNLVISFDPNSAVFQDIEYRADNVKDSGCAHGPTYLVYERSTAMFYEFYCGNASGRWEAGNINKYLPVTLQDVKLGLTDEKSPRDPLPMTLGTKYIERGTWAWFTPQASECLTPFAKLPTVAQIKDYGQLFMADKGTEVELVEEDDKPAEGRAR